MIAEGILRSFWSNRWEENNQKIKGQDLFARKPLMNSLKFYQARLIKESGAFNFGVTKANQSYPSGIIGNITWAISKKEKIALIYSSQTILVYLACRIFLASCQQDHFLARLPVVCFDYIWI